VATQGCHGSDSVPVISNHDSSGGPEVKVLKTDKPRGLFKMYDTSKGDITIQLPNAHFYKKNFQILIQKTSPDAHQIRIHSGKSLWVIPGQYEALTFIRTKQHSWECKEFP
jgi:hypothetical protein